MKKLLSILFLLLGLVAAQSCKKDDSSDTNNSAPGGDPSPMAAVGTTMSSSSLPIAGISSFTATVVSNSDGISSYSGKAIITNTVIKNILSNYPAYNLKGDTVSVNGFRFKQTVEGIVSYLEHGEGTLVNYSSNVGDTYTVGSTGRTRTVTSKSTTDDYFYGGLMIKVMKIEEPTPGFKNVGISKVTYFANHRFGLVGVQYGLTDGSSIALPVYCSAENGK
jgi:hypothetical protein